MAHYRKINYKYLIKLIKNAKHVICLDADIADWNIAFLQSIIQTDYIVYFNKNKNKIGTPAIIYDSPQVMIDLMADSIKNNKHFVACFDCLQQMNDIINYLSQFGNKNDWLIYSSEINYTIIDTEKWIDKFIFFTPSIIYGIDYNHKNVDVFSFVFRQHLNPLQIYQMISRARKQNVVHLYCNPKQLAIKYYSVDDLVRETQFFEKNLEDLSAISSRHIDINDEPYRIMFFYFIYIDSLLKTNIKAYLIDILINRGYIVSNDATIKNSTLNKKDLNKKYIKDRIVALLHLNKNKLSEFETNHSFINNSFVS
jgi:hypothetical protein